MMLPALAQYDSYGPWLSDVGGINSGHTVGNFLNLPVSAAQLGQGSASSVGSNDASDIPRLSANTAFFNRYFFSVSHLEWIEGLRQEYVGVSIPILDVGTLSFYSQLFTIGDFGDSRDIDEYPTTSSETFDVATGVAFAREVTKGFALGLSASYLESRLAGVGGRAGFGNIDLAWQPVPWGKVALYARNIGSGMQYSTKTELLPLQAGLALRLRPVDLKQQNVPVYALNVDAGVQKTADQPLVVGAAMSHEMVNLFTIRAGYEYLFGRVPSAVGLSLGAGMRFKNFVADFGWKLLSQDLGAVWGVTLALGLEEITPMNAEDFYAVAEKHFIKGRYILCVLNAKKTLRLNPNLWKAHTLLARVEALRRRQSGLELAIIYTGNIKGQYLPMIFPQGGTMGGLSRATTVIKDLRRQFPLNISIDAGTLIPDSTHILKAKLAGTYLNAIKYSALGLGSGEINYGLVDFVKDAQLGTAAFISSNSKTERPELVPAKIITIGKYRLAVLSVIGPLLPGKVRQQDLLNPIVEQLTAQLLQPEVRASTLRILIIHDSWENIKIIAAQFPEINVIICGALSQRFESPMRVGKTYILSPGENGLYVGKCILNFNESQTVVSCANSLIPLNDEIPADTEIAQQVESIAAAIDRKEQGLPDLQLVSAKPGDVVPFVSMRHGSPQIFLKIVDKPMEFPLTNSAGECLRPRLSPTCGKIVYFERPLNATRAKLMVMNVNGAFKMQLPFEMTVTDAIFAPDGENLLVTAQNPGLVDSTTDIYRIKCSGLPSVKIFDWKESNESDAAFSPDGKQLAFVSDRDGSRQIYVAGGTGADPMRITEARADHGNPQFNATGQLCAFLSNKDNALGRMDLYLYDAAVGSARRITGNASVFEYCWLDFETILYSAGINMHDCNSVNVRTMVNVKFIKSGGAIKDYNETSPHLITTALGTKKVVYVREYTDGVKKIYWADLNGLNDRLFTTSEKGDWLD